MHFSIYGARPGLFATDLLLLGWAKQTESTYIFEDPGASERSGSAIRDNKVVAISGDALVRDGVVTVVSGDTLYLGKCPILRYRQPVSPNRMEILDGLGLPLLEESSILGPPLAAQYLEFKEWGLLVGLSGDVIDYVHLRAARTFNNSEISSCYLTPPKLRQGCLTSVVKFRPSLKTRRIKRNEECLSIDGVYPGTTLGELLDAGWSKHIAGPDYVGLCLGKSTVNVENGAVTWVSGERLLSPKGKVLLERGKTVSPSRIEVFDALGLPFSHSFPIKYSHQPPIQLIFPDLGLTFLVTDEIRSISLEQTGQKLLDVAKRSAKKYSVKTPPGSPLTRVFVFK